MADIERVKNAGINTIKGRGLRSVDLWNRPRRRLSGILERAENVYIETTGSNQRNF